MHYYLAFNHTQNPCIMPRVYGEVSGFNNCRLAVKVFNKFYEYSLYLPVMSGIMKRLSNICKTQDTISHLLVMVWP